jgi:hypothetical protein
LTAEQQQPNDEHNIAKEDTKKKHFTPTLCNTISSLQCCQTPLSLACDYHISLSAFSLASKHGNTVTN